MNEFNNRIACENRQTDNFNPNMSKINCKDILLDLKIVLPELYFGTLSEENSAIEFTFENGQSFIIKVKENVSKKS